VFLGTSLLKRHQKDSYKYWSKNMTIKERLYQGNRFFVTSVVIGILSIVPLSVFIGTAFAFTLLGEREIRMGSSQPGDVTDYTVEFDVSTSGDLGGIVVTFCANTPTIGDPECETPSNFDVTSALANLDVGDIDLTGYQADTADHSSSGAGGDNTVTLFSGTGYSLGDTGPAGGLIFHIDGNDYYEAAPAGWDGGSDPFLQWGCRDQSVPGADGTAIGDGVSNTQAIADFHDDDANFNNEDYYTYSGDYEDIGCHSNNDGTVAAKTANELSLNGYSDWFLPSRDEINVMYTNLHAEGLGGFADSGYWSSFEDSPDVAQRFMFNFGSLNLSFKDENNRVRPARSFTLAGAQQASTGETAIFDLVDVTNQDVQGTFYARIYTYEDPAHALGYTLEDPWAEGDVVDAGGVALSTAETIDITFQIPERLTFCVFTNELSGPGDFSTCDGTTATPVSLGDDLGFLSPDEPSISKDAKYNIATNAPHGAMVRIRGSTLNSGSLSIDAIGDQSPGDGVATSSSPGTEQFGLCTYQHTDSVDDGILPLAPYNHTNCEGTTDGQGAGNDNGALFAFHEAEIDSIYGHPIAQKDHGDWSTGIIVFLANITAFTEPGVYTTTFDVVATGQY
jgi:hypothetical protein